MSEEKKIKAIITKYLSENNFKIFLFGSRATGINRPGSDFDVGIMGKEPVGLETLGLIDEEIDNSNIPYKVDVVDFARVSEGFKKLALKQIAPL